MTLTCLCSLRTLVAVPIRNYTPSLSVLIARGHGSVLAGPAPPPLQTACTPTQPSSRYPPPPPPQSELDLAWKLKLNMHLKIPITNCRSLTLTLTLTLTLPHLLGADLWLLRHETNFTRLLDNGVLILNRTLAVCPKQNPGCA